MNWLTTATRRLYLCNIIIYKILHLHQPNYLTHLFTRHHPKEPARGASKNKELTLPNIVRGRGANSFQVLGVKQGFFY